MKLEEIVAKYGTPPPEVVKQRDNGSGFTGDYVGHGHVTKMLIEIDPMWDWQPAAWIDGKPAITITESTQTFRSGETKKTRIATMWGFMTVLGKTLPCVGSARADKEDVEKELIGDLIRNGALRFGVCINLWARTDDNAPRPSTSSRQYETRQEPRQQEGTKTIPNKFKTKCAKCGGIIEEKAGLAINDGSGWVNTHKPGECDQEEPF